MKVTMASMLMLCCFGTIFPAFLVSTSSTEITNAEKIAQELVHIRNEVLRIRQSKDVIAEKAKTLTRIRFRCMYLKVRLQQFPTEKEASDDDSIINASRRQVIQRELLSLEDASEKALTFYRNVERRQEDIHFLVTDMYRKEQERLALKFGKFLEIDNGVIGTRRELSRSDLPKADQIALARSLTEYRTLVTHWLTLFDAQHKMLQDYASKDVGIADEVNEKLPTSWKTHRQCCTKPHHLETLFNPNFRLI